MNVDTIIIGGGHNGLVCAAYLAKAGKKVTVLEAADQVGGAAATREFAPGYRASVAHLLYLLDKDISKDLALESHGLKMAKIGLKTIALAENGDHITIGTSDVDGGGLSDGDKAAYKEYRRFMAKFAGIFSGLHNRIPPRITRERGDMTALGKMALNVRMLGRNDMRELLRIGAINIYDVLQENFDDPLLKGALSLDAVLGTNSGPQIEQQRIHRLAPHERKQRWRSGRSIDSTWRNGRRNRGARCRSTQGRRRDSHRHPGQQHPDGR